MYYLIKIFSIGILLFLPLCLMQHVTQIQEINIGAIFNTEEIDLMKSFEEAVNQVNYQNSNVFKLIPSIRNISTLAGSIELQNITCDLIGNGVAAIFGPSSKARNDIVSLLCNNTGIPHIQFDIANEETYEDKLNHQMTINVYPSLLILSKSYSDIIQSYGWKKFTMIYDGDDVQAPSRLQDLLQLRDIHNEVVRVRKFHKDDDPRALWKSIKGERRVVLDCSPDILFKLINASVEFDLMGQFNHLFLTNLDTGDNDWKAFADEVRLDANITVTRLKLNKEPSNVETSVANNVQTKSLLTHLVHDAVYVFAETIKNITRNGESIIMPRVKCDFVQYDHLRSWHMGADIVNYMKGVSGVNNTIFRSTNLQFDDIGQRVNFNIEIYEPINDEEMAYWDTKGQITTVRSAQNMTKKIVYQIASRFGPPYFMEIENADEKNLTGNNRYEGYAVDLIKELSKEVGFEYQFKPVADNLYGTYNKDTKQWNGIIGELINNDAHMGICDLTITQARRSVVDFTVPFMQLGISILAYKEPQEENDVLAFLETFDWDIWGYVVISIFLMSFLLAVIARISKTDWENPHPCNSDPEVLENKWDVMNTMYLTVCSIMTAGCDILPLGSPTRFLTAMWWIFAMIITNSYTANLAAFLTSSKIDNSITDLKKLAEQTTVKFGTIEGGSTYNFFAESNESVYRLAFNLMNNDDPSPYTKNNQEGVDRVLRFRGKYMFLMETTSLEYNTERDCHLRSVGETFGEKHYAIAMPFGAKYRSSLSVGILKLSERGELFRLKKKWWTNENGSCSTQVREPSDTDDLNFEEIRGIFYMLALGIFIATVVGIIEFLMYTLRVAATEKITFKHAFFKEIRFVLCIWSNKKPVVRTPTGSTNASSRHSSNCSRRILNSRRNTNESLDEIHRTESNNNNNNNNNNNKNNNKNNGIIIASEANIL